MKLANITRFFIMFAIAALCCSFKTEAQNSVLSETDIEALRTEIILRAESAVRQEGQRSAKSTQFKESGNVNTGQFTVFHEPPKKATEPKEWSEIISKGVIEDYIAVIEFMAARSETIEALRDSKNPETRDFADMKKRKVNRIIFHEKEVRNGRFPNIRAEPGKEPVESWSMCEHLCQKMLLENYTQSIAYIYYDKKTGKPVPGAANEYRRTKKCNQDSLGPTHLRLCIETINNQSLEDIIDSDGLHIYDRIASPLWPEGFYPDRIAIPSNHIMIAAFKDPPAFENLENITVQNQTEHKALRLKQKGEVDDFYVAYDHSCVFVSPGLPGESLSHFISEIAGKKSKIYIGQDWRKNYSICIGEKIDTREKEYFSNYELRRGIFDYPSIISNQEIVSNLSSFFWENPKVHARLVTTTIGDLQRYHPDFQSEIWHSLAPIVMELAKMDLGSRNRNGDDTWRPNGVDELLMRMPHESMSYYTDDLIRIIEDIAEGLGCIDLKCPKGLNKTKGAKVLLNLAKILNGAGPDAAPFLDRLLLANLETHGNGAHWYGIGGERQAASCIGVMGPEMEKYIANYAYRSFIKPNFYHEQSLRMTSQSSKARQHIEEQLDRMIEKSKDPELDQKWARTNGLIRSIERAEKILEEWTDSEPYCPTRTSGSTTW